MKIYDVQENREVNAQKVYKTPRFNSRFGKTWQWGTMILDGEETSYTYDNTWGSYWYFRRNLVWYKVSILNGYEPHWRMAFVTTKIVAEK